jgi:hypothetical protein
MELVSDPEDYPRMNKTGKICRKEYSSYGDGVPSARLGEAIKL